MVHAPISPREPFSSSNEVTLPLGSARYGPMYAKLMNPEASSGIEIVLRFADEPNDGSSSHEKSYAVRHGHRRFGLRSGLWVIFGNGTRLHREPIGQL